LASAVKHHSPDTLADAEFARGLADQWRATGRTIVLTNGCFDVLHVGHTTYLRQARQLGGALLVGVNSDDSVRRLKGPPRPLNRAEDRVAVLEALACVDGAVVFPEPTPHRLIATVRPDIYVKGGDYRLEDLPERTLVESYGGRVEVLDFVTGHSTSALLGRLLTGSGATSSSEHPATIVEEDD